MDTSRFPHFDDTDVFYWSARMTFYLETINLSVWRVTHNRMKPLKNPEKLTMSDKKKLILMREVKLFI